MLIVELARRQVDGNAQRRKAIAQPEAATGRLGPPAWLPRLAPVCENSIWFRD
jgi:hypothetical protein